MPMGAAFRRVHHRLEQRTENGGRNLRPVETAGVQQRATHGRIECRNTQRPIEQLAVDIGKPREVFVERSLALGLRRIQHLEQLRQPQAEIGPVFAGARLQEVEENIARGSKMSVSSANRQNTIRTRNRSRS